ncbi:hypothetical protein QBC41DRAFT_270669 [Cercophora samala]|uniref:Uncharacterized protein n=1 Tax=Cercophora samala TaxID=330535 RepID=A0AA39ZHR3_9PEZI|nr:hypothetical protein QBC41DRAFT_270669 [Cercophora samala]
MSAAAHPNGNGNAHPPLAGQASAAHHGMPDDIYQEVRRNMMASLDRVRQEDMRNFQSLHAAHKAALEQEQMEYTQQFFQLQKEMADLTKEGASVDAEIARLEEQIKQARKNRLDVANKVSYTQQKCVEVQSLQHRNHAELQALTKKHEQDLEDKEMRWEMLYQERLNLVQSKTPSSVQHAQDQNPMVPEQTMADAAAIASAPMPSLRAPQLAHGVTHQSTGPGGMFMGGPVQPPSLKAPTDNGPHETSGLQISKRSGAPVLEAPMLPRSSDIESPHPEGASRSAASQRTPILQAPAGYQAPFSQPRPPSASNLSSSPDALVSIPPTVVPSVESPDGQTTGTVAVHETQKAITQSANGQVPEEDTTPPSIGPLNGATDTPTPLQPSKEVTEMDISATEGADGQSVELGVPPTAEVAPEDKETGDVKMTDAVPSQVATEMAEAPGEDSADPSMPDSPDGAETRAADEQGADVENPPALMVDAAAIKLTVDSGSADAGSPALAETADSPLSDLSSIPSPPSDTFTHEDSPVRQPPSLTDGKLCVYDEDGKLVGEVRPLTHTTSSNIEKIAAVPLKRHVQIRSGRRFTSEDLERIYHGSDVKGTKWTSCYIQATGEVQGQPCNTCAKHNGPYEECIVLDADDSFPKCGNCEWNRHACVGASLRPKTASAPVISPAAAPAPAPAPDPAPASASASASISAPAPTPTPVPTATSKPSIGSSFTAVNSASADQQDGASGKDAADAAQVQAPPPIKKAGRKSLPTSRVQLPSQPGTPRAGSPEPAEPSCASLPEITKETLCLRDDGTVYTEPPFMAGVPLAKISPDHPYWEQDWDPDIDSHIRKELDRWTAKFQEMDSQGIKDHRKYEAQRQINRGQLTLKFLEEGELHPYQLVGKAWVEPKKLVKYNTLYRLASTLMEDLPKMDLGMTPAEWMRQRLYEIQQEQGPSFNLASTVASFYHDPKHAQVRAKNGIVSVGRPHKSTTKPKTQTPGQEDSAPKQTPRVLKRKEPHATPKAAPALPTQEDAERELQPQQPEQQPQPEPRPRSSPRKPATLDQKARPRSRSGNPPPAHLVDSDVEDKPMIRAAHVTPPPPPQPKKKIRVTSTVDPSNTPDLYYNGFTDVDSCSDDKLEQIDWRVNQIKTAEVSTNPGVTQYWHWVDDAHPGYCEHQVLKQLRPPKWAVFKEPYNFHLKTVDCEEIVYGPGSHRVIIRRKAHLQPKKGDMLAEFKRDRTKKRFLEFMHQRGVRIVRSNKEYVEGAWENLKPAFDMPGQDRDSD